MFCLVLSSGSLLTALHAHLQFRFGSASPKVHYSEACVPKLVYKLAEACYVSVTGTNPNPKP